MGTPEITVLIPRNGLCTKAFPQMDNEIYRGVMVLDDGFLEK